ncbi:MAG: inorganic phosphate transporter [Flavobacteriaceae bacterium]|nr:inorganic phosphate transporter [Flavobacteriaceae bacterium]
MEQYYLILVGLLAITAIFDLMVGVSNDAVNFLNSSIGAKVAPFRIILIVATIGIIVGATTSGGMMEVARKGVYNPEQFFFNEIMILFLAVMITDVILLDLFNTLGLPTSTTVSIVFELLGATLALSFIKILQNNEPLNYLFNVNDPAAGIVGYVNWGKTTEIITGILLSVVIAFTIGVVVQYIARFLFSFDYKKKLKSIGTIWSGFAFTAILYFLLFKGFSSVVSDVDPTNMNPLQQFFSGIFDWLNANVGLFLIISFLLCTLVMFLIQKRNINPLKPVVLFGTFALAMAFAGNDLVNFIGVPIAGWQSFQLWMDSGVAPSEFSMAPLAGKVETPYFLLLIAGFVMALTLWFSKKARTVTETEVSLGTQTEIEEKFRPNYLARVIVKGTSQASKTATKFVPGPILERISKNFTPLDITEKEELAPAFDLVRASVNLVVASILIATATDLKLPLSTTYVTFMVAMGASLADRAWGRESAVYRVAGVMHVIGGWFMTAILAATASALIATFMYFGGMWGIIICILLAGFFIFKSGRHHSLQLSKKKKYAEKTAINFKDVNESLSQLSTNLSSSMDEVNSIMDNTRVGLFKESRRHLQKANTKLDNLREEYLMVKDGLYKIIKNNMDESTASAQLYVRTYDLIQDMIQSLNKIVMATNAHVQNNHKPMDIQQTQILHNVLDTFKENIQYLSQYLSSGEMDKVNEIIARNNTFQRLIEDSLSGQIKGVMDRKYGFKNTDLFFTLMLELKDLSAISTRFMKMYYRVSHEGRIIK